MTINGAAGLARGAAFATGNDAALDVLVKLHAERVGQQNIVGEALERLTGQSDVQPDPTR